MCGIIVKLKSLFLAQHPPVGYGLLIREVSRSQNDAPQSVGLLWTSDQLVAKTSTWQHTQHSQQINIHASQWGFEPTISAGERPQTYALDRVATGTGKIKEWELHIYFDFQSKIEKTLVCLARPPGKSRHCLTLQVKSRWSGLGLTDDDASW